MGEKKMLWAKNSDPKELKQSPSMPIVRKVRDRRYAPMHLMDNSNVGRVVKRGFIVVHGKFSSYACARKPTSLELPRGEMSVGQTSNAVTTDTFKNGPRNDDLAQYVSTRLAPWPLIWGGDSGKNNPPLPPSAESDRRVNGGCCRWQPSGLPDGRVELALTVRLRLPCQSPPNRGIFKKKIGGKGGGGPTHSDIKFEMSFCHYICFNLFLKLNNLS